MSASVVSRGRLAAGQDHPHHHESAGVVDAPVEQVFAYLDDHVQLSAHMTRRSWRMAWGKMTVSTHRDAGRAVGSHIRLAGRVLGLRLMVEEVVVERRPDRKRWETVGEPRLLVIGPYEMGFVVSRRGPSKTDLVVAIDYGLPTAGTVSRLLGRLFGGMYARWCTRRMVNDAQRRFARRR